MALNSRAKGNRAERQIASMCKKWWSKIEKNVDFVRTPLSGGWQGATDSGARIRAGFGACGDLMTTAKKWPFTVEVKDRENWAVARLLKSKPTAPWGWWAGCVKDAIDEQQEPMLWMHKRRNPWYVMISRSYYDTLSGSKKTPFAAFAARHLLSNSVDFSEVLPVLFLAEDFLRMNPRIFAK